MDKTEEAQITGYSPNTSAIFFAVALLPEKEENFSSFSPSGLPIALFKADTDLITELRNRISELENDKLYLQKQNMDLWETIRLLTIKQLPGNQKSNKGVFTKIKEFFTGE